MRLLNADSDFAQFEAELSEVDAVDADLAELEAWFLFGVTDPEHVAAFYAWGVSSLAHDDVIAAADVAAEEFFELLPAVTEMRVRFSMLGVELSEAISLAARGFPLV